MEQPAGVAICDSAACIVSRDSDFVREELPQAFSSKQMDKRRHTGGLYLHFYDLYENPGDDQQSDANDWYKYAHLPCITADATIAGR